MNFLNRCARSFLFRIELKGAQSCTYSSLPTSENRKRRAVLFDEEHERQRALITDIHKIKVDYTGLQNSMTLVMNKGLSTPADCGKHISSDIHHTMALARVDNEPWDMHKYLQEDCTLTLHHFREEDPYFCNKAFWKSLSVMLGSVIESIFKDDITVQLLPVAAPDVSSGSFIYDAEISASEWIPKKAEMIAFSGQMARLALEEHPFIPLDVSEKVASNIFCDNQYKLKQISQMCEQNSTETVTLYKVGDFVDLCSGPLMSHTKLVGKCTIGAVHKLKIVNRNVYRFQGIALPNSILLNHFSYGLLEKASMKLNNAPYPVIESERTHKQASMA